MPFDKLNRLSHFLALLSSHLRVDDDFSITLCKISPGYKPKHPLRSKDYLHYQVNREKPCKKKNRKQTVVRDVETLGSSTGVTARQVQNGSKYVEIKLRSKWLYLDSIFHCCTEWHSSIYGFTTNVGIRYTQFFGETQLAGQKKATLSGIFVCTEVPKLAIKSSRGFAVCWCGHEHRKHGEHHRLVTDSKYSVVVWELCDTLRVIF